ncbi:MAG TPA: LysR family transcriptional regulator [Polyangiales bacterium]
MDVDLNAVSLLLRVVRGGSFSAAARELQLPVSSVSRRVAALEQALGVSLLVRTTRSLRLTDAGRVYTARAGRAMDELDAVHDDVRRLQTKPQGRVRITAPASLGKEVSALLLPLLARHPDVALEVDLSDERRDLMAGGFDIAIRAGKPEASELVARKVLTSHYQLFASPNYLRRAPRLRELSDLREHRLLASRASDGSTTWALWHGKKPLRHRFAPSLVINEMAALKFAVVDGVGIALMPTHPCAAEIARGELVRVLPELRGKDGGLWLQSAKRTQLSTAASVVVDHLLTALPTLAHPL